MGVGRDRKDTMGRGRRQGVSMAPVRVDTGSLGRRARSS